MDTDTGIKGDGGVSRTVIGAAFRVANALGVGFLEKVYENSLAFELRSIGCEVEQQKAVDVRYRGEIVGIYCADLLVDGRLIVELKVAETLSAVHKAQCLNYLRASGVPTGLVINFGRPRLEIHRVLA